MKLLVAVFVALLMAGCGEDDSGGDSSESNQTSAETPTVKSPEVGGIDLDDNETRNRIIAEAIDGNTLQERAKEGEKLAYAPNQETPYTGWGAVMHDNGQIEMLAQIKDGKPDGHVISWYENGRKRTWNQYKDGKLNGLVAMWYENGQKKQEATYKDDKRDGLMTRWYENGDKKWEGNFKGGKLMTSVVWKPNGEKCPVTNVKDGNGVSVGYYENGQKERETNFKDGNLVTYVVWKSNCE